MYIIKIGESLSKGFSKNIDNVIDTIMIETTKANVMIINSIRGYGTFSVSIIR